MDPVLIVAPHLDDAVLSCGEFVADWPGCVVWTACCGLPPTDVLVSSYDKNCGFTSPALGMSVRLDEEQCALGLLRATSIVGTVVDNQYRTDRFPVVETARAIFDVIDQVRPTRVYAPLGLLHPDHVGLAAAALLVYGQRPDIPFYVYEELPARVIDPTVAASRLLALEQAGHRIVLEPKGRDRLAEKLVALGEYGSQSWAWAMREVACTERVWKIEP